MNKVEWRAEAESREKAWQKKLSFDFLARAMIPFAQLSPPPLPLASLFVFLCLCRTKPMYPVISYMLYT